MLTVKSILEVLDDIAPFEAAEDWDNVGLLIGDMHKASNRILLALDINETIIDEAINKNCDLIITHHPMIFKGIKRITSEDPLGRCILKLIKHNISVIASHTNLDRSFKNGINYKIATLYNLSNIEPLNSSHGFGVVGTYDAALSMSAFIENTKKIFKIQQVKIVNPSYVIENGIYSIAICSGSASEYIPDAINQLADVYITSDIKFHEAQGVIDEKLMLVDVGHFESEVLFLQEYKQIINQKLRLMQIHADIMVSETECPLFNYY